MTLLEAQQSVAPIVTFFSAMMTSGVAVSIATQMMKSDLVPIPAQKYPRITAAVVSIGGVVGAMFATGADLSASSIMDWIGITAGILVTSAITYEVLLKKSAPATAPAPVATPYVPATLVVPVTPEVTVVPATIQIPAVQAVTEAPVAPEQPSPSA
jgi:hypothetical protein